MQKVKLGSLVLDIPEDENELKIGSLIKLREIHREGGELIDEIAAYCNIDPVLISKLGYGPDIERGIINIARLIEKAMTKVALFFETGKKFSYPKEVILMGKKIKVPSDLEKEPFWAAQVAKNCINEFIERSKTDKSVDILDYYPRILAHYLFTVTVEERYSERRADDFEALINSDLSVYEAVTIGNFFFLRSKGLLQRNTRFSLSSLMRWNKRQK